MPDNHGRKSNANRILYGYGLLERLEKIGKPHIIGSYRMDMMAWNDLDIDIANKAVLEGNAANADEFLSYQQGRAHL